MIMFVMSVRYIKYLYVTLTISVIDYNLKQ